VTYGSQPSAALTWTPAARERMRRVPSFVRGVVMRRVEDFARARGLDTVSPELLRALRSAMPVDFSRRRPFFLDDE
jgi:hypothetical protein